MTLHHLVGIMAGTLIITFMVFAFRQGQRVKSDHGEDRGPSVGLSEGHHFGGDSGSPWATAAVGLLKMPARMTWLSASRMVIQSNRACRFVSDLCSLKSTDRRCSEYYLAVPRQ
jgi:hypothetical protein